MYSILVDGKLLYAPGMEKEGYAVLNPKLTKELNKAGSLTFQLPPGNVMYDSIKKLKSVITVMQNDEEEFRGRELADEKDFYNRKNVTCEGELAFLLDSQQRPYELKSRIEKIFRHYISVHNSRVDSWKRFTVGEVTVDDDEKEIIRSNSDYSCTFDEMNEKLLGAYGGYLRPRLTEGVRYIDYVKEYGNINSQVIRFGVNLLDITEYISAENVFTVLIPIGAERQDENGNNIGRVTIEVINNGKDWIEDETAINLFGRIERTEKWDDIKNSTDLLNKGTAFLQQNIEMAVTLKVKAIDLHLLNVDTEKIKLGDYVRVVSLPHKLDKYFLCSKIVIDLVNPDKTEFTFGVMFKTLTEKQAGNEKTMQSAVISVQSATQSVQQSASEVKNAVEEIESIITNIPTDYVSAEEFETYKETINQKIGSVYRVKGSVASYVSLPATDNSIGDVYNLRDTGANYVWTDYGWDKLSETVDVSGYATKEELETGYVDMETYNNLLARVTDIEERME